MLPLIRFIYIYISLLYISIYLYIYISIYRYIYKDCRAKVLVTADQGLRGGRPIHLKKLADAAIDQVYIYLYWIFIQDIYLRYVYFIF